MSEAQQLIAPQVLLGGKVTLFGGDNRAVLRSQPDASVDSIVTDPPYALVSIVKRFGKAGSAPGQDTHAGGAYARASAGFMGKQWDTGEVAFAVEFWAECLRVLKPGGHVVAFSHCRTYHRMACAIEDAGFEIRDMIDWLYGSGFPKNHDVALDFEITLCDRFMRDDGVKVWRYRDDGAEMVRGEWRHPLAVYWDGWGTALKPAKEPICLGRKPIEAGNIVGNVEMHGTGAINIDSCRIGTEGGTSRSHQEAYGTEGRADQGGGQNWRSGHEIVALDKGRFPANVLHDGSAEILAAFPEVHGAGAARSKVLSGDYDASSYNMGGERDVFRIGDAGGSASRFFYSAKADAHDRIGSKHPTVKPVDLMQWLVRLVTPKGGLVLDPFAGTGTTGEAAFREGMRAVLIEREPDYQADIVRRMALALAGPEERARESIKAKLGEQPFEAGSLFADLNKGDAQ